MADPFSSIPQINTEEDPFNTLQDLKNNAEQELVDNTNIGQALLISIGRGMTERFQGIKQRALKVSEDLDVIPSGQSSKYTKELNEELKHFNKLSEKFPTTTTVGRLIGDIAVTPIPGLGTGKALAQIGKGAAYGAGLTATSFSPENKLDKKDLALGATLGALPGATISSVSSIYKAGKNIYKGSSLALKDSNELANTVTEQVLNKFGGDFSKVTPEEFVKEGNRLFSFVKKEKNRLYNIRNQYADDIKATVDLTELKESINFYARDPNFTKTEKFSTILNSINKNPSTIKYADAEALQSLYGKMAYKTPGILGDELNTIKHKIINSIDESVKDPKLAELHTAATSYIKNKYYPLENLNLNGKLLSKYTEEKFLSDLVRGLDTKKSYKMLLDALSPDLKKTLIAAHTNSLKQAAINPTSDLIDINKYSNLLGESLKKNPELYGEHITQIKDLAHVLSATGIARKFLPSDHGIGQSLVLGAVSGGIGSTIASVGFDKDPVSGGLIGLGIYTLPKGRFLYTAGKMINNPASRNLLNQASKISEKTDPVLKRTLYEKITKSFINQSTLVPVRISAQPVVTGEY